MTSDMPTISAICPVLAPARRRRRYSRFSRQRENALAAVHFLDRTNPEQPKNDRTKSGV
jgi:hypothetical protein